LRLRASWRGRFQSRSAKNKGQEPAKKKDHAPQSDLHIEQHIKTLRQFTLQELP